MTERRPFLTFIARAHRRRLAWRLLEFATIGLLMGCGVAAAILAIAWWRGGTDAIGAIVAIMLVSMIAGAVASIWRRPSVLDTTTLLDRQLNSPELLSSALLTSSSDFAGAVHVMADARVAGESVRTLVLRRCGSRTFIGAMLACTCVLIVAMISSSPIGQRTAVAGPSRAPVDSWISDRQPPSNSASPAVNSNPTRPLQRDPDSAGSDRSVEARDERVTQSARQPGTTGSNGAGGGSSRSSSDNAVEPPTGRTRAGSSSVGSLASGGSGAAASLNFDSGHSAGVVTSNPGSPSVVPPWQSGTWSGDREAALQAVQNGSVPDSYRSLVQDYFDRR